MSATSQIPLWGRAWELSVTTVTDDPNSLATTVLSSSKWDPEALRVVFEVKQTTFPSPFWFADVAIYNLDSPQMQNLLFNAVWLILKAGYQIGGNFYGTIWKGPILQVIFDRDNVVDQVIRFNCVAGPWLLAEQFINTSQGVFSTQIDAVSGMIQQIGGKVSDQVSETATKLMKAKQYPRGKTIFGKMDKYLSDMSEDNFLQTWIEGNQRYVSELADLNADLTPDLIYSPPFPPGQTPTTPDTGVTRSIIGVPQQNPYGTDFTVLLDPRLKVGLPILKAKLDLSLVRQLKQSYPRTFIAPLDKDSLVFVGQVTHRGDTRGNDWYTDVTGARPGWAQGFLAGVFGAQSQ